RQPMVQDNSFCYTWLELEFKKGSNEVASAVFHRLCVSNFDDVKKIRLVCDGCAGQNKNSTMIGMLSTWFSQKAPSSIKTIEVVFPIVGHSYMPPDRLFGRIEKRIRKETQIIKPNEYFEIFKECSASVVRVGTVCQIY